MPGKPVTNEMMYYKLECLEDQVQSVKKLLTGNGHPEDGVILRLDRTERTVSGLRKIFWVIVVAVAAVAVDYFLKG